MSFKQTLEYVNERRNNDDSLRLKRIERNTAIIQVRIRSIRMEAVAIGAYGLSIAFMLSASPDLFVNISKFDFSQLINFSFYTVLSILFGLGGTYLIYRGIKDEHDIIRQINEDYKRSVIEAGP